jgi:hypothetical protein
MNRFGTSHHVVLEVEQYQESFFVPSRPKAIAAIGRLDTINRTTREEHEYTLHEHITYHMGGD